ncbi:MAG: VCBS repeat-containing protein [Myxococcales bacterium]|nr:VCBS repeat-containing protein [Myxococcales bacterium]
MGERTVECARDVSVASIISIVISCGALVACGDSGGDASTASGTSVTATDAGTTGGGGSESTTGDVTTGGMSGSDSDASAGPTSDAQTSTTGTDGETTGNVGPECSDSAQCNGDVCVAGECCPVDNVCGEEACCSGDELCLFGQCVVPGAPCKSVNDCEQGEYCEPALGEDEPDPDPDPDPDMNCTQDIPPGGFCLALPKSCDEAPDDPDCVDACEFYPEKGELNATIKWQWGLYDAEEFPDSSDVWATPTVARIYDANCDGVVDQSDPPNIVLVSGDTKGTCCSCGNEPVSTCRTGILRLLDGSNGKEIWSLEKAVDGVYGFAGMSVALGDIDDDGSMDIIAMTGDGYPVWINSEGEVVAIADTQVSGWNANAFGWGGGLAIGDMDGNGWPEIAYGRSLYTTGPGAITFLWSGAGGTGGGTTAALSYMVDLDTDGLQELLAGNTVYEYDSTTLWSNPQIPDGFTAVGDLDFDGEPEVVVTLNGTVRVLEGGTGVTELGPVTVPGVAGGGPPTIANFDGGDDLEIGIATGSYYMVYKPNYGMGTLDAVWSLPTKDTSSRITGSSVFDFEGDGRAEVIYSDECFLWVLDGEDGSLRFAAPNTTFTATEAIIVADVDGDGHAEIVRVSNSANWSCNQAPWTQPDPMTGRPGWTPPENAGFYQGITAFGDSANSWVGTRSIWNQHAYFVSNFVDVLGGAIKRANSRDYVQRGSTREAIKRPDLGAVSGVA